MDEKAAPLVYDPVVFLVGHEYQIVFNTAENGIAYVKTGGKRFTDQINGTVRSARCVHKITLPCALLDEAREYTIGYRPLPDRAPYRPVSGELFEKSYDFRPVEAGDGIQVYMLADTHSHATAPAKAASYFGDRLDLLVLCGDIANKAVDLEHVGNIFRVASLVTHGSRPVVFARGNHDTRGAMAETLGDYVGTDEGRMYFTFRAGPLWGVVVDCGEDKIDSHVEYGDIADYRPYREAQTAFLKRIIENRTTEYDAPGVEYRVAVCHLPFTCIVHDFADDIYDEWTRLLDEMPIDLMLTGHVHRIVYHEPGEKTAEKAVTAFPVVVGSRMSDDPKNKAIKDDPSGFTGTALEFKDGRADVKFTNSAHAVIEEHEIQTLHSTLYSTPKGTLK